MEKDSVEVRRLKAAQADRELRKGRMEASEVRKVAARKMRRAERK